jgi:hypothetical protein
MAPRRALPASSKIGVRKNEAVPMREYIGTARAMSSGTKEAAEINIVRADKAPSLPTRGLACLLESYLALLPVIAVLNASSVALAFHIFGATSILAALLSLRSICTS